MVTKGSSTFHYLFQWQKIAPFDDKKRQKIACFLTLTAIKEGGLIFISKIEERLFFARRDNKNGIKRWKEK